MTSAETDEATPVTIGVLSNDSDIEGDPLFIDSVFTPGNGTVIISGTSQVVYTPDAGFIGDDSFFYVASDGELTSFGVVQVAVNEINFGAGGGR